MSKYIMAFDQGTTSSRCIIYDKKGNVVSSAQKEITQIYPQNPCIFVLLVFASHSCFFPLSSIKRRHCRLSGDPLIGSPTCKQSTGLFARNYTEKPPCGKTPTRRL